MQNKKGFTLLEIMISIIGFSLLMVIIFTIFQRFITLKYNAQARGGMIEKSYFVLEKINLLLKDYTIDYEEYFNRWNVGCNSGYQGANFKRNVGLAGNCGNFTAYGNRNSVPTSANSGVFVLYYCSSVNQETSPKYVTGGTINVANGSGCNMNGYQSFGEYKQQFWDVKSNVDFTSGSVGDDDDYNVGLGPQAILDVTGVQELYLISQDGTRRIFLRRTLVESGDRDGINGISGDTERFYTIEMLKLRGFDAGNNHDFNTSTSSGVYDGTIDTWACDYAQGFVCGGANLGGAYSGFNLPASSSDGWIPLFERNLTIADRNLLVFPSKDPEYAWKEDAVQMNPYFTIAINSKLYGGVWFKKLRMPSIEGYQLGLQTTFNTKNFYTK